MVPGVSRGSQCPCGPCAYCDVVRHKEMDEKVVVVAVPVRTDKDKIPRALKDTLTVMTDMIAEESSTVVYAVLWTGGRISGGRTCHAYTVAGCGQTTGNRSEVSL